MVKETEFYDRLGVTPDVGQDQLRKAYYRRARECHPDKHPGDKAKEAEFKALSEAYQVLSDPDTRKSYDQFGKASLNGGSPQDARDIFATAFGGPEFEPYVGTMGQLSEADESLQQRAEEANDLYQARRYEVAQLQSQGMLDPQTAAEAQRELQQLKQSAIDAQSALQQAHERLQRERVQKCAQTLRQKVDEYISADQPGQDAWLARLHEEFEKLRHENMGEPMMHAIGYAYVYQAQKQLGRHGVGVHRLAGHVEDARESLHNFSEIMGAVGTAIGTFHASYKLMKASEREEAGHVVDEKERAELEKRASQKAIALLWAVNKKDVEDTIRATVDAVLFETDDSSSSSQQQQQVQVPAVSSSGPARGSTSEDTEYYSTLQPMARKRAEAIIVMGRQFLQAMPFEQFIVKDEEPSQFRKATRNFEESMKGRGIDVDEVKRNIGEKQESAWKAAEEAAKHAGIGLNKLFGWRT